MALTLVAVPSGRATKCSLLFWRVPRQMPAPYLRSSLTLRRRCAQNLMLSPSSTPFASDGSVDARVSCVTFIVVNRAFDDRGSELCKPSKQWMLSAQRTLLHIFQCKLIRTDHVLSNAYAALSEAIALAFANRAVLWYRANKLIACRQVIESRLDSVFEGPFLVAHPRHLPDASGTANRIKPFNSMWVGSRVGRNTDAGNLVVRMHHPPQLVQSPRHRCDPQETATTNHNLQFSVGVNMFVTSNWAPAHDAPSAPRGARGMAQLMELNLLQRGQLRGWACRERLSIKVTCDL